MLVAQVALCHLFEIYITYIRLLEAVKLLSGLSDKNSANNIT